MASTQHQVIASISQHFFVIGLAIILVLACMLRFYRFADVPHGMTWDEAAIGYNGFAIRTTHRDEYLNKMPLSFKSFGDFKSPLVIYVNGIFTLLFGMNLWAVRLPFVLSGVLAVLGMALLISQLFAHAVDLKIAQILGLVASGLMAVSPWHLQFSRSGFESGVALMLLIWGIVLGIHALDSKKNWPTLFCLIGSVFSLSLSLYAYHSAKIVLPALLLALTLLFWKQIWQKKLFFVIFCVAVAICASPMIYNTVAGDGGNRFNQVSIFTLGLSGADTAMLLLQHTAIQFSPQYLFAGATTTLRHSDGQWGILFPTEGLLVLASTLIFFRKEAERKKLLPLFCFGVFWVIVGSLPAIISRDVPHANRALLSLPGFSILSMLGLLSLIDLIGHSALDRMVSGSKGETHLLVKTIIGLLIFTHGVFVLSYLHHYYTVYAETSADDFKDGYLEAFHYVKTHQGSAQRVLFTSSYGQPYIYALFSYQMSPIDYQGAGLSYYEFSDKISAADIAGRTKTIIVASPDQVPLSLAEKVIYGSDHQPRFLIMHSKDSK